MNHIIYSFKAALADAIAAVDAACVEVSQQAETIVTTAEPGAPAPAAGSSLIWSHSQFFYHTCLIMHRMGGVVT